MSDRDDYRPGAASGADVRIDGDDRWTLILVRELRHPPSRVWEALTDPEQLRQWAPYDADRNLGAPGPARLSTVGTSRPQVDETTVTRAEAPRLLEHSWGGNTLRWELEPVAGGTRLTLWHAIGHDYITMGAAGWHICLDVLTRLLAGEPIGRIVGPEAMKFEWPRLRAEYAKQFGLDAPNAQEPHDES